MADNNSEVYSVDKKNPVSFGFSKKIESRKLQKSKIGEHEENYEQKDYVKVLEDRKIQSSVLKEEKQEFVIPLTRNSNGRLLEKKLDIRKDNDNKISKPPGDASEITVEKKLDTLDTLAIKELIEEATLSEDKVSEKKKSDRIIPLLLQNIVPAGFETNQKLDVSLLPDENTPADYEQIPVEAFGEAMLRGMGWKPGKPIGKTNVISQLIEPVLRPKGLGLGADRALVEKMKNISKNKTDQKEELSLVKGACVLIEKGVHKDLYGKVEGLNEECLRVIVRLALSNQVVDVSQTAVKIVDQKEYDKESRVLNRAKYNEYKEKEETKEKEHKRKHKDYERDHSESRRKNKHKKRKHEDSDKKKKRVNQSDNVQNDRDENQNWVQPMIRVRFIDRKFKEGKYYNSKMTVVDVPSCDSISLKTEDGLLLEEISSSMLETVIPKNSSDFITVLTGKHKGQIGCVLRRDKSHCVALVRLQSDHNLIELSYNDICEYVGDAEEM